MPSKYPQPNHLHRAILSKHSFGVIKTFRDCLTHLGLSHGEIEYAFPTSQLDSPLSREQLNDILNNYEQRTKQENHPYKLGPEHPVAHTFEGIEYNPDTPPSSVEQSLAITNGHNHNEEPEQEGRDLSSPFILPFIELHTHQTKATNQLLDNIDKGIRCQLLRAGTGTGKTFMIAAALRYMIDHDYLTRYSTDAVWPFIWITRASIVTQTERVAHEYFGIPKDTLLVVNIEQMRAKFGELFLNEKTIIRQGEEHIEWAWRPRTPLVVIVDESHLAKNEDSTQSKIIQSMAHITKPLFIIASSATPFSRVKQAKYVVVNIKARLGKHNMMVSMENWPSFAKEIAYPAEPEEYSRQAVKNLMECIDPYVVHVKNVRSQFHAVNNINMIDFRTDAERKYYEQAWERFMAEKAKLEERADNGVSSGNTGMQILAELLKFRQAAELIKCEYIADAMYDAVVNHKQASFACLNFKASISKCVYYLTSKHGVPRDQISLIWGGGASAQSAKQKAKAAQRRKLESSAKLMELMSELDIEMTDLGLGSATESEFAKQQNAYLADDSLKLGVQSKAERQRNIDRFQNGKALYCFYTFKAGGVGLSLHHTDELTKEKCRRKKSGFAFVEDIPKIPTRQRFGLISTTYSEMELVQGLGRGPRLTSLSDTIQLILFYRGTIEERVSYIVSCKLRCLQEVVKTSESWEKVILGQASADDYVKGETKELEDVESILEDEDEED